MRLPTKNVDGVVKFYTDNSYSRAEFPTQDEAAPKLQLHVNDFVQFDLDVWFNPIYPFEAKNIKVGNGSFDIRDSYDNDDTLQRSFCYSLSIITFNSINSG